MGLRALPLRVSRGEVPDGGNGHFYGADAVAGEVVDADAEKVGTFGGDTDLFVQLDASVEKTCDIGGGEAGVRGGDILDDDRAILIVGVDRDLEVAVQKTV